MKFDRLPGLAANSCRIRLCSASGSVWHWDDSMSIRRHWSRCGLRIWRREIERKNCNEILVELAEIKFRFLPVCTKLVGLPIIDRSIRNRWWCGLRRPGLCGWWKQHVNHWTQMSPVLAISLFFIQSYRCSGISYREYAKRPCACCANHGLLRRIYKWIEKEFKLNIISQIDSETDPAIDKLYVWLRIRRQLNW